MNLIMLGAALLAGGVLLPLLPSRLPYRLGLLTGAAGLVVAAAGLFTPSGAAFSLPSPLPGLSFHFGLDPTTSFFGLLLAAVGLSVNLYSLGYLKDYADMRARLFVALLQLLYLDLLAVLAARDIVAFLFAWGVMGLLSYLLLVLEPHHPDAAPAAFLMTVITEGGAMLVLLGFLILGYHAGSLFFPALAATSATLSPLWRDAVFFLILVGFGTKIGVVPFGIWLPRAHPAGPANFSAILSGVLVAMGLYGFWRVDVLILGPGPAWWGGTVLLLGVISALSGIIYALLSRELKRILAYSTIENMGIVLAAWGAAGVFASAHLPSLAALAAAAGFFHLLNHGLFKGLLFLGAGSVDRATGVRTVDLLGGLVRRLPLTASAFFLGSLAIAGLPPLNGFTSEWLTLQSFLLAYNLPRPDLRLLFILGAVFLALTAGLAITLFVKLFGVAFLGLPRSAAAEEAKEPSPWMATALWFLGAACLGLGLFPTGLLGILQGVAGAPFGADLRTLAPPVFTHPSTVPLLVSLGGRLLSFLPLPGLVLAPTPSFSSAAPAYLGLAVAVGVILAFLIAHRRGNRREAPAWNGGYLPPLAASQYTALGYAGPVRTLVKGALGVSSEVVAINDNTIHPLAHLSTPTVEALTLAGEVGLPGAKASPFAHRYTLRTLQEDLLYRPVIRTVSALARRFQSFHTGSLGTYLLWLLLTLVVALLVVALKI